MPTTKTKRIRILLVDDHPVVRQGLRAILSSFEEIEVAGEAGSGQEAIDVSRQLNPDVVVMDISMPHMSGIEATAILSRDLPSAKVLALSMHENRSYVAQALRAGARGYILKDAAPKELAKAISDVFSGTFPISPQAANVLMGGPGANDQPELTPREADVLRLIARGCTNKEMSIKLGLSVRTVETHREHLIRKTACETIAGLTRYAVAHGYVELHSA